MPLASCPRCSKTFMKEKDRVVCEKCVDAEEADYERVQNYVSQNPDCSPAQVAEGTGIRFEVVMRVVGAGRVAQVDRSEAVRCGRCGAPAISLAKKLCETCLAELNSELARHKSLIKLPPKKWTNIESGQSTVRQRIDEYRKRNNN
jgi:ribosomal protein L37E